MTKVAPTFPIGTVERRGFAIQGVVQGVGFRPFVHATATRCGLTGWVRNDTHGVTLEVEGLPGQIARFAEALSAAPPPCARIESMIESVRIPLGEPAFEIRASCEPRNCATESRALPAVAADMSYCDECLKEFRSASDRRRGYCFIACSHCGPRLSIALDVPYDRERTTLARFPLCSACEAEYRASDNRRFHAQPMACPCCGPALYLLGLDSGQRLESEQPLEVAIEAIRAGAVIGVKGMGGYHLVCDGTSERAVRTLRRSKVRRGKPFAVLVPGMEAAEQLAILSAAERHALLGPDRPIVICRRRSGIQFAEWLAPHLDSIGLMLPYTPLHLALAEACAPHPLVVTSANVSGGPIATNDEQARQRLAGVASLLLSHDRDIAVPCEDSVVRVVAGRRLPVRRSRGACPSPTALPHSLSVATLALGGALKATFAIGQAQRAIVSPHFGDLRDADCLQAWERAIEHFERLFKLQPRRLVHDLHPDYESTQYACERARVAGLELVGVQHHHAHMAACMAEHGLEGSVIGVCFDGLGQGTDGAAWGGEFLVGGYESFSRAAHLLPVPMPGGDQAVHQPWRMALAHLLEAGLPDPEQWLGRHRTERAGQVRRMLERDVACPRTTSMGRLFDAVAAITLGIGEVDYDAEGACRLEALAERSNDEGAYRFQLQEGSPLCLSCSPLWQELTRDLDRGVARRHVARRFHAAVADAVVLVCQRLRSDSGCHRVVLSGGVFCNAWLARHCRQNLEAVGLSVYQHERLPPNDGGLCLGQLAIVAARDQRQRTELN